jgi:uncharacterized protein YabN with tetrapyrrole methylase and pyrophosphatase domain
LWFYAGYKASKCEISRFRVKLKKKFKDRFQYIEHAAKERGLALTEMTLEEMDAIWDEAKVKGL